MSAYIVNDGVINRIVNYLWSDAGGPQRYVSGHVKRLGYLPFDRPEQLGRHMHQLNRFAIRERYMSKEPFTYKYEFAWPGCRYQILRDFQCFLYQCSEGRADKVRLFEAITRAKAALMQEIISEIPAYKAAEWNKE